MIIQTILKEWSSAIRFYEDTGIPLIFRKGGIHEKTFQNVESYFGIFETYEHESKTTVKPEYSKYLSETSVSYPGYFNLLYIGKIKNTLLIDTIDKLDFLDQYHLWEKSYLIDRFNFRQKNPLYCYLIELNKMNTSKVVEYDPEEARGCLSWFKIKEKIKVNQFKLINDSTKEKELNKLFTKLS